MLKIDTAPIAEFLRRANGQPAEDWIGLDEAAKRLGVCKKTVRLYCVQWERWQRGELPTAPKCAPVVAARMRQNEWFVSAKWIDDWNDPQSALHRPRPIEPNQPQPNPLPAIQLPRRRIGRLGHGLD